MTYLTYQGNDADCGFAALKMLLANSTRNKSYLYIPKPSKKRDYTFADLTRIAKRYGLILLSYEMPKEDSRTILKSTLVLLTNNHMVYVIKNNKRRIIYFDPELGKVSMNHKAFQKKWKGYVMECVNTKEAKKIKIKKPILIPIWMDIIYYAVIGAVLASLMTGFYLIKDNSSILLTMGFLLLFALGELVENWYIIKELKLFDKQYLTKFFSRKTNQNIDKYKDYCNYRSNYFVSLKVLVSSLVLVAAFAILLCLNDFRNIFVFVILLLVRVLDNIIFSKREKKDAQSIAQIEKNAFEKPEQLNKSLLKANSLAYRIALNKGFRKVVYLFLAICLAFGMMLFSGVTSTNFLIFHFGIYFIVSQAFEGILNYCLNGRDRKRMWARFLDDCDL